MWQRGTSCCGVVAAGSAVRGSASVWSSNVSSLTRFYTPYVASTASAYRFYSSPAPAPLPVKRIGIVGAGQMGAGIAQVAAQVAKIEVVLLDTTPAVIEKSMAHMEGLLKKNVAKGKITQEEAADTLKRIKTTTDMKEFSEIDFAVEAVTENVDVKQKIFTNLDANTPKKAILASNTSSISISKIASFTSRPDKVIGMHFMNPVPVMKLVEIIPGLATSGETLATTQTLAAHLGKTTTISDDRPGFIANRLLLPYINEGIMALQEGLATRDDIDTTMKLGCNMPMGPLQLADFIGLDTCLSIMRVLHKDIGDTKYRPSPLLVKYVDAGWLGVKSGRGFYEYPQKA